MITWQPPIEAMFQLRIDTVTVVEEISQVSVVNRNKYSKALDSGEASESCCRQSSFQQPHVEKVEK